MTGSKLVLFISRKSYTSFRLVPKSVTLNDIERRNGHYFALLVNVSHLEANYVKLVAARPILSAI